MLGSSKTGGAHSEAAQPLGGLEQQGSADAGRLIFRRLRH